VDWRDLGQYHSGRSGKPRIEGRAWIGGGFAVGIAMYCLVRSHDQIAPAKNNLQSSSEGFRLTVFRYQASSRCLSHVVDKSSLPAGTRYYQEFLGPSSDMFSDIANGDREPLGESRTVRDCCTARETNDPSAFQVTLEMLLLDALFDASNVGRALRPRRCHFMPSINVCFDRLCRRHV